MNAPMYIQKNVQSRYQQESDYRIHQKRLVAIRSKKGTSQSQLSWGETSLPQSKVLAGLMPNKYIRMSGISQDQQYTAYLNNKENQAEQDLTISSLERNQTSQANMSSAITPITPTASVVSPAGFASQNASLVTNKSRVKSVNIDDSVTVFLQKKAEVSDNLRRMNEAKIKEENQSLVKRLVETISRNEHTIKVQKSKEIQQYLRLRKHLSKLNSYHADPPTRPNHSTRSDADEDQNTDDHPQNYYHQQQQPGSSQEVIRKSRLGNRINEQTHSTIQTQNGISVGGRKSALVLSHSQAQRRKTKRTLTAETEQYLDTSHDVLQEIVDRYNRPSTIQVDQIKKDEEKHQRTCSPAITAVAATSNSNRRGEEIPSIAHQARATKSVRKYEISPPKPAYVPENLDLTSTRRDRIQSSIPQHPKLPQVVSSHSPNDRFFSTILKHPSTSPPPPSKSQLKSVSIKMNNNTTPIASNQKSNYSSITYTNKQNINSSNQKNNSNDRSLRLRDIQDNQNLLIELQDQMSSNQQQQRTLDLELQKQQVEQQIMKLKQQEQLLKQKQEEFERQVQQRELEKQERERLLKEKESIIELKQQEYEQLHIQRETEMLKRQKELKDKIQSDQLALLEAQEYEQELENRLLLQEKLQQQQQHLFYLQQQQQLQMQQQQFQQQQQQQQAHLPAEISLQRDPLKMINTDMTNLSRRTPGLLSKSIQSHPLAGAPTTGVITSAAAVTAATGQANRDINQSNRKYQPSQLRMSSYRNKRAASTIDVLPLQSSLSSHNTPSSVTPTSMQMQQNRPLPFEAQKQKQSRLSSQINQITQFVRQINKSPIKSYSKNENDEQPLVSKSLESSQIPSRSLKKSFVNPLSNYESLEAPISSINKPNNPRIYQNETFRQPNMIEQEPSFEAIFPSSQHPL